MPGMDNMTEFKLFIGMLPRTVGEDGLRAIFQPYGSIIEVVVLREPDGSSRGCAFVKYHRREDAVNAINACNGQMFFQVQRRN
jgi:CUG-BP- and ETR3-like factor